MPDYEQLRNMLILGAARRAPGPALAAWLEGHAAVDPAADEAEQLLAAWALGERQRRLAPRIPAPGGAVAAAPAEERGAPPRRLQQAAQLILRDGYERLLPEFLTLLDERELSFPATLLPDLLTRAVASLTEDPATSRALLAAAGTRGRWLAAFNPAWQVLRADFSFAEAFATEQTPGHRQQLLKRWRQQDPAAARAAIDGIWSTQSPKNQEVLLEALAVNIGPADADWLRSRFGPRRRGVRRALLRLLLRLEEPQAMDDAAKLAAASLDAEGRIVAVLTDDDARKILDAYGGVQKKESLTDFLLDVLPPWFLPDLLGQAGPEWWSSFPRKSLVIIARTLLRYPVSEADTDFVRFVCQRQPEQLLLPLTAQLVARLSQDDFIACIHDLLDTEDQLFHFGSPARLLVLQRTQPWSERITKAFVHQLIGLLREGRQVPYGLQQDLKTEWTLAIPLLDLSTFGWLRTQLHAVTERGDFFGKLATETLQTTAFRRAMREG